MNYCGKEVSKHVVKYPSYELHMKIGLSVVLFTKIIAINTMSPTNLASLAQIITTSVFSKRLSEMKQKISPGMSGLQTESWKECSYTFSY